jgi:DnaJ-class molecular chaperone
MRECWTCEGAGWVSNGDIDDGMMTGRMTCYTCRGRRVVTEEQLLQRIEKLANLPRIEGAND